MFTLLTLGSPLGVILGYIVTAIIVNISGVSRKCPLIFIELEIPILYTGYSIIPVNGLFYSDAFQIHSLLRSSRTCYGRQISR
jgi:hypothetical protein